MAVKFNENNTSVDLTPEVTLVDELTTPIRETKSTEENNSNSNIQGLSAIEMNDPNSISVTVSDPIAPVIVLFGPPACGKTMTLVRLTRHLQSEGYTVQPIRTFRPTDDTNYADICTNFDAMINNNNAAESTSRISFMLVAILKNGKTICQILEAPGEFYFNPKMPNAQFPNYVSAIIGSNNRKIWTIMVEPDWLDLTDRKNYVSKIKYLKQNMGQKDKVVFVFNKIDKGHFVRKIGDVNVQVAITAVQNLYPNIFTPFLNENPVTKLFKKYNCEFIPFQTGFYAQAINGITYQEGPSVYCKKLWNTLMKNIYG